MTMTTQQLFEAMASSQTPKYKRTYTLYYRYDAYNNKWLRVTLPVSIDFDISRNNLSSTNNATFTLYNLSQQVRDLMYRDPLDVGRPFNPKETGFIEISNKDKRITENMGNMKDEDISKLRNYIEVWMGYESIGIEYMVFAGAVLSAFSYKQGVDYLTEISAYSINLRDPQTYYSYVAKAGTTKGSAIRYIATQLAGIHEIHIDPEIDNEVLEEDTVMMGTAEEIISKYMGYKPFVDNYNLAIFSDKSILKDKPLIIDQNSGLLASPRRTQNGVSISMLFEPLLQVGLPVQLNAEIEATYNDTLFAVTGFKHSGSISTVKDSKTITEAELITGKAGYFRPARTDIVSKEEPKNDVIDATQDTYAGTMMS